MIGELVHISAAIEQKYTALSMRNAAKAPKQ
ncbi:hypothetical protein HGE1_01050 [Anaplasma phagocytophilum str. HGE1]|uniref:Uncharacterized protein n=1 Tax=Anaplasma phagocytophilum (strain HZ) TaxID=212042 RepID=Q2GL96_ANAPZ|nr:hypothetical protein APH_0238 [Anaplasma phagocytophilum str. HZ]EOA61820.1 hypothetical protein HGE1_01050 [Anaplasma phagocytophilum str. HGE1]